MESICRRILKVADEYPSRIAIVAKNEQVNYREFASLIYKSIDKLKILNLKKGDAIVILASKSIEFLSLYFAAHLLRIITIPIDKDSLAYTIEKVVKDSNPSYVISFEEKILNIKNCININDIFIENQSITNCLFLDDDLDDVADIMFTSGTTGIQKGVMLSHKNISVSAMHMNSIIKNTAEDTEVLALPIFHSFGLGRARAVLSVGGTLVLHDGFANVKSLFKTIHKNNATGLAMVPASWRILKKMAGSRVSDISDNLKYIELGSSKLNASEKKELMSIFPHTSIYMHYGLTEASRSVYLNFKEGEDLESIGIIDKWSEIKIIDNNGFVLNEGEKGEICIKGEHVFKGYLNEYGNCKTSFWGDFFRSGDIGYLKNNHLYLEGRVKDIANIGGKKVSLIEIEDIVNQFDGVQENACVSCPDDILGEKIKLFIVTSDNNFNLNELNKYLAVHLESHKIPSEIALIDHLPKTSNGKVKKFMLK